MAASAPMSELTVTCNQCGSASLDRLDRKEYRCNHCGAITLISDNDADRIETLLRDALAKQQSRYATYPVSPGSASAPGMPLAQTRKIIAIAVAVFGLAMAALIYVVHSENPGVSSTDSNVRIGKHVYVGGGPSTSFTSPKEIPSNQVTLSPPVWIGEKDGIVPDGEYTALLYNHSGSAIDVPDYSMTFYPGGLKGGSAFSGHDAAHLLPGEYTRVTFRTVNSKDANARYEIEPPKSVHESMDELARLPLEQPQLVRQTGTNSYRLIGIVRNTLKRSLGYASVSVILYGPNHQILGGGLSAVGTLRPGEKAAADASIFVDKDAPPVRSYDYLVDATLERPDQ